jgi:hypothetical protein
VQTWGLVFLLCIYFAICWGMYTVAVEPLYGALEEPTIGADSAAYFEAADDLSGQKASASSQLSLGGSTLGPGLVALVFRTPFGVAWFNCALFAASLWWAGMVPGVNRVYFAMLLAIQPQMLPTLMTLNKEMMAIAGLLSFCAYIYAGQEQGKRRGSVFYLFAALVLSFMGRWQQILILFWYLAMEARRSPLRGKPRKAIVVLLMLISVAWVAGVRILHLNLGGFIIAVEGAGTAARLYGIQEKGGYFLVALPKIIMYLAGRWVTPAYFFYDYWMQEPDLNWENAYFGILGSLCMLLLLGYVIVRGRFRLDRPLIYLTAIYFICTAVNPFIQPRYIFPSYVLLALEMSRRSQALEPVKPLRKLPPLAPSYRALQSGTLSRAG